MSQLLIREPSWSQTLEDRGLLVTWRNPLTNGYILLGRLGVDPAGSYEFNYFAGVQEDPNFRPIPGFGDPNKHYSSTVMFPFFSGRLMGARRPDRPAWLAAMGLAADAQPFEILGRSFGHRVADTYELYREPALDLETKTLTFVVPVHGLRHQGAEVLAMVDAGGLQAGTRLLTIPEPGNEADPRAVQLVTQAGQRIGYVPAPVLDYLGRLGYLHATSTAAVEHVNPPHVGHHLRIIAKITWTV